MGCELPNAIFLAFIRQLCTLAIYVSVLVAPWLAMIGTFRSSLGMLLHDWRISILVVQTRDCPVSVCIGTKWVLYCLLVGIHASIISIPLSSLILSR